jgi:hypothetical protein
LHLGRKLLSRNPLWYALHHSGRRPTPHPLFRITSGGIRSWERVPQRRSQTGVA